MQTGQDRDVTLPNQTRYQTALCPAGHRPFDTHFGAMQQASLADQASAGVENRRSNAVARSNAEFSRRSADDF
jgi:hypothetical protein